MPNSILNRIQIQVGMTGGCRIFSVDTHIIQARVLSMTWFRTLMITGWLVVSSMVAFAQTGPIDKLATRETINLYRSLETLSAKHVLFGHQHATEYGHGWTGDADRSDVKSVTGSHPAVIGVDIMGFTGRTDNEIAVAKANVTRNVIDTYERGGVTTVAWHFSNPISKGAFYWVDTCRSLQFPQSFQGAAHTSNTSKF